MVTIYIAVNSEGFITTWGTSKGIDDIQTELEKDHPFFTSDKHCWKYVDGELVFDETKRQQREDEKNKQDNKLTETEMLAMAIMDLTDIILGGID